MNNSELCGIAKKLENRGEIERAYQFYLEAAIAEDDGEAMNALAKMYFEGDYVRESYDKAGKFFGMAYDRKADVDPGALIIAGCYFEKRVEENEKNLDFAMKYYQAAADLGESYGHECLGKIYFELGDYGKAYENLKLGDGNNPLGLYYLGRLYDEGLFVDQDRMRAIELYEKAVLCGREYEEECGMDEHSEKAKERLYELDVQ